MTELTHTSDDDEMAAGSWTDFHIDPDFHIPAKPERADRTRAFSWRRLFTGAA
jgi:hypothetical protein